MTKEDTLEEEKTVFVRNETEELKLKNQDEIKKRVKEIKERR